VGCALAWGAGLYLRFTGAIAATSPVFEYAKLAVLAWIAVS
jgi:hypothetical protein